MVSSMSRDLVKDFLEKHPVHLSVKAIRLGIYKESGYAMGKMEIVCALKELPVHVLTRAIRKYKLINRK